jgi:GNAT superfamily N-acetyltransferase
MKGVTAMPRLTLTAESAIVDSPRVQQVRGLFDLPTESHSRLSWEVVLPLQDRRWHIGLIVGPSGCGKSTIARGFWPDAIAQIASLDWPMDRCLLDAFPDSISTRDVTALLCAVGFSSPPAWLRPFPLLSTGQQFRVTLARLLAEAAAGRISSPIVCDEFTSVVDRTVAQIGSAALQKAVRQRGQQFIAVTCHEDVGAWLQPDWTYQPALNLFQWRYLQRRPEIALAVVRCAYSAWPLFAPHHYLNGDLARSATCFLATWHGRPVAFSSWLPFLGRGRRARREHRTVTLPDYQGVGIGNALSNLIAALWKALGFAARSTTTHPAMIRARLASGVWRMTRAPAFASSAENRIGHATTRLTTGFEYVGPPLPRHEALALLNR